MGSVFLETRVVGEVDSLFDAGTRSILPLCWSANSGCLGLQPVWVERTNCDAGICEFGRATPAGCCSPLQAITPETIPQPDFEELVLIRIYRRVAPDVICIKARDHIAGCVVSGLALAGERHVVTNNHVVKAVPGSLVTLAEDLAVPVEVVEYGR